MVQKIVDMHMHSSLSDGHHPPEALWDVIGSSALELADEELDLRAVSLADHDTLLGVETMMRAAAGGGIRFVPGVEVDCASDGGGVHLLVYFPKWDASVRTRIRDVLLPLLGAISERMDDVISRVMVERINACPGIRLTPSRRITPERVRAVIEAEDAQYDTELKTFRAAKWSLVGRLMMEDGYVEGFDEMRKHLKPGGCCKCGDVKVPLPYTLEELLAALRGDGFVLILAHPATLVEDMAGDKSSSGLEKAMQRLLGQLPAWHAQGLDGLECYSSHSERDFPVRNFGERLLDACRRESMLVSGGSDFHGGGKKEKIGVGFGSLRVPYESVKGWCGI